MLPTTGAISFADLKNEFSDTDPISLNEFYSGGLLVPIAATGLWGVVPTAGAISVVNFKGSSGSLLTGAHWSSLPVPVAQGSVVGADNNLAIGGVNKKSSDYGFTWQNFAPAAPGRIEYFLNGRFFVENCATYSDDLITWTTGPALTFYNSPIDMCVGTLYGQQRLVRLFRAVDAPYVYGTGAQYSTNGGSTWSSGVYFSDSQSYAGLNQVVFFAGASGGTSVGADGLFIHQPHNTNYVETSPDAVTWTKRYIYLDGSATAILAVNSIIHNNLYMAVSSYGKIVTSSDGINYSITSTLPNVFQQSSHIALASCGSYVLAAYKLTDGTLGLATTTDGVSWTVRSNLDVASDTAYDLLCVGNYWLLVAATNLWHAPI